MRDTVVCPYFDHDEDICDVGCGYISSHDASMIIKFCSCHYQNCQKYRELSDRPKELEPVPKMTPAPSELPVNQGDPLPVLGLLSYTITVAFFALDKLPVGPLNLHWLAIFLMLGSVGQISAGLNALKKNLLKAIAFTSFGLFWLSILALDILPRAGYGSVPTPVSMVGYLGMWAAFGLVICQGARQLHRACRTVFAMMTAFLFLLALASAIDNTAILHGAAFVGLTSCLPGLYCVGRYLAGEARQLFQTGITRSDKVRS